MVLRRLSVEEKLKVLREQLTPADRHVDANARKVLLISSREAARSYLS